MYHYSRHSLCASLLQSDHEDLQLITVPEQNDQHLDHDSTLSVFQPVDIATENEHNPLLEHSQQSEPPGYEIKHV